MGPLVEEDGIAYLVPSCTLILGVQMGRHVFLIPKPWTLNSPEHFTPNVQGSEFANADEFSSTKLVEPGLFGPSTSCSDCSRDCYLWWLAVDDAHKA